MTRSLRITLTLCLGLVLGWMSFHLASARGMAPAVGQIELCTGHGPVMVFVDAEGQPTRAPVLCPDYALSVIASAPLAEDVPLLWRKQTALRFSGNVTTSLSRPVPAAHARGPPAV